MDSSSPPPFPLAAFPPADADHATTPAAPILRFSDGAAESRTARPYPTHARVNRLRVGPYVVTAIHRRWPPGASGPGGTCRLCPACTATGDGCQVQVPFDVPDAAAPLFAVADLPNPLRQHV